VTTAWVISSPTRRNPAAGQAELGTGNRLHQQSQCGHRAGLGSIQRSKSGTAEDKAQKKVGDKSEVHVAARSRQEKRLEPGLETSISIT